MRYAIYIEKDTSSDYGVTVPDLPGCFSAGSTIDEALANAQEAILTHIEGMFMDNDTIPPTSSIETLKQKFKNRGYIWALCDIDTSKLSENVKRVNITIPERLLTKIDTYAKDEGETRSGFLTHAALDYIARNSYQ